MTVQGELLESSFQAIVLHGEAFVTAFYERLFTRFPETRALFAATDMFEQRKKLQQSLALIVEPPSDYESVGREVRWPECLTGCSHRGGATAIRRTQGLTC